MVRAAQKRVGGRLSGRAPAMAARGAKSLVISVLRDNFGARGFYEHLGGEAEAARLEPVPGGGCSRGVARWADIRMLTG